MSDTPQPIEGASLPPLIPAVSPCEALITGMICELETEYSCAMVATGDLIQDSRNVAILQVTAIKLGVLYEVLIAVQELAK